MQEMNTTWAPPVWLVERAQQSAIKHNISISEAWERIQRTCLKEAERILAYLYAQRDHLEDDELPDQKDIEMWESVRDRCNYLLTKKPWDTSQALLQLPTNEISDLCEHHS